MIYLDYGIAKLKPIKDEDHLVVFDALGEVFCLVSPVSTLASKDAKAAEIISLIPDMISTIETLINNPTEKNVAKAKELLDILKDSNGEDIMGIIKNELDFL